MGAQRKIHCGVFPRRLKSKKSLKKITSQLSHFKNPWFINIYRAVTPLRPRKAAARLQKQIPLSTFFSLCKLKSYIFSENCSCPLIGLLWLCVWLFFLPSFGTGVLTFSISESGDLVVVASVTGAACLLFLLVVAGALFVKNRRKFDYFKHNPHKGAQFTANRKWTSAFLSLNLAAE